MGTCTKTKPPTYPQLGDRDWLVSHYVDREMSCEQVAELIGCSSSAVAYRLEAFGIPRRGRHSGRWNDKQCERCGETFTPGGPAARFCSAECRTDKRECAGCARLFTPHRLAEGQGAASVEKYCSDECRNWAKSAGAIKKWEQHGCRTTPTRRRTPDGYIQLYFGKAGGDGYRVLEHRYVMEQHLGRELEANETVHHKDTRRRDWNDIENLQLRRGAHGVGGAFECRSCGSHDIVAVDLADPDEAA